MSFKHVGTGVAILVVLWAGLYGRLHAPTPITPVTATPGQTRVISFDDLEAGQPPAGFLCAAPGPTDAKPAKWQVIAVPGAPSTGQVLEQSDGDATNYRYPVALAQEPLLKDLHVAVRAKAVRGGERDRSFGVVLRARDERNYYVARANTSSWGDNVRFYKFVNGQRTELDEWEGEVQAGVWHQLEVSAVGTAFTISLDGRAVLRVDDATFTEAGMAGVWTKAESVSQFDDLTITPLNH